MGWSPTFALFPGDVTVIIERSASSVNGNLTCLLHFPQYPKTISFYLWFLYFISCFLPIFLCIMTIDILHFCYIIVNFKIYLLHTFNCGNMLCRLKWRFSVENPPFFPLTYFVDFCPESPLLTIFPILISKKNAAGSQHFPDRPWRFYFYRLRSRP